jgi:hypothetical protein
MFLFIMITARVDAIPFSSGWNNHHDKTLLEYERAVNLPLQCWRLLRLTVNVS